MDAAELRQAVRSFLGEERYRRLIKAGVSKGRLRFWQQDALDRFIAANASLNVHLDALRTALCVCEGHGDELKSELVPIIDARTRCVRLSDEYMEAFRQLFPHAEDRDSAYGTGSGHTEIWYCPSCRTAKSQWNGERLRRA